MRRAIALFAVILGAASLAATSIAVSQEVEGTRPACVSVQATPRMQAFGWDHIVTVQNACPQPVTCSVTTDVNPTATSVSVPAGQSRDTLMWRGSPASVFRARVDCPTPR